MFIDFLCISLYLYILDIICENPISAIGISPKPQGFHQGNPWMATVSFVLPAAAPLHRSVEMDPTKRRNDGRLGEASNLDTKFFGQNDAE
jgi:hypothetical protein